MARAPSACLRIVFDCGGDETGAVPVLLGAANLEDEILQNVAAAFGVIYFGMKFDAIASARRMLD